MGQSYGFPDPIEKQLVSEFLAMPRNVVNRLLFETELAGIPPNGVELVPIESHGDHKSDIRGLGPFEEVEFLYIYLHFASLEMLLLYNGYAGARFFANNDAGGRVTGEWSAVAGPGNYGGVCDRPRFHHDFISFSSLY